MAFSSKLKEHPPFTSCNVQVYVRIPASGSHGFSGNRLGRWAPFSPGPSGGLALPRCRGLAAQVLQGLTTQTLMERSPDLEPGSGFGLGLGRCLLGGFYGRGLARAGVGLPFCPQNLVCFPTIRGFVSCCLGASPQKCFRIAGATSSKLFILDAMNLGHCHSRSFCMHVFPHLDMCLDS